jgi:hypothetical protein
MDTGGNRGVDVFPPKSAAVGWKYVCFENRSWLLFNPNDDTFEEANLAYNNRFRPERKKMISRLKQ